MTNITILFTYLCMLMLYAQSGLAAYIPADAPVGSVKSVSTRRHLSASVNPTSLSAQPSLSLYSSLSFQPNPSARPSRSVRSQAFLAGHSFSAAPSGLAPARLSYHPSLSNAGPSRSASLSVPALPSLSVHSNVSQRQTVSVAQTRARPSVVPSHAHRF
ncbi:hypothetical protein BDV25DRAFT_56692 [Aspergillus avenaceus]|uniref:Uncharacterized protein n=1 Tax=Aspergillus avenaceus TaxID=36643 RepID=A0A5N6TIG8_ASPAV|nr:hypothetical protein BDV25DRAFT_56692 [Aspergillus avenaceus]